MLIITLTLNRVWFPPDQSHKLAQAYVDWLKANPPDRTVEKTLCIAVGSDEKGDILVYGIGQVKPGKEQEALTLTSKGNLFMASKIDGLKYKTELLMDFTEAYKILDMSAPEEV